MITEKEQTTEWNGIHSPESDSRLFKNEKDYLVNGQRKTRRQIKQKNPFTASLCPKINYNWVRELIKQL